MLGIAVYLVELPSFQGLERPLVIGRKARGGIRLIYLVDVHSLSAYEGVISLGLPVLQEPVFVPVGGRHLAILSAGMQRFEGVGPAGVDERAVPDSEHFPFNGIQIRWSVAPVVFQTYVHQAGCPQSGMDSAAGLAVGIIHILEAEYVPEFVGQQTYPRYIAVSPQFRCHCEGGEARPEAGRNLVLAQLHVLRPHLVRASAGRFRHSGGDEYQMVEGSVGILVGREIHPAAEGTVYAGCHLVGIGIAAVGCIRPEVSIAVAGGYQLVNVENEFSAVGKLRFQIGLERFCQAVYGGDGGAEMQVGEFHRDNERPVLLLAICPVHNEQQGTRQAYGQYTLHALKILKDI